MKITLKSTDRQYQLFLDLIFSLSKDVRLKPGYRQIFGMFFSESQKHQGLVTNAKGISLFRYIEKALTLQRNIFE